MTQPSRLIRQALGQHGNRKRKRALRRLACAPWMSPRAQPDTEADTPNLRALRTPAELVPGQVLLVGVSADLSTVDLCSLGGPRLDATAEMVMSPTVLATRDSAIVAAQRTAPLRIRPLARMPEAAPIRVWTESVSEETTVDASTVRTALDGRSFGLALYLRCASFAANVPLAVDVVALASIDEQGRLAGVDGLAAKLAAVARCCPRIETVFVAREQVKAAEDILHKLDSQIGVATAHSAAALLPTALAVDPRKAISALSDGECRRVVSALFQLALDGHGVVSHWAGIAVAAAAAAEIWGPALSAELRGKLLFAASVASRHHSDGVRPLPPFEWTSGLPQFLRHQVLAHYIQDSTDRGSEWATGLEDEIASICAPGTDPTPAECRVMGAWARWLSVTGKPAAAMALQQRAARQWLRLMQPEQASHPLCEWMRLAGALQDHAAAAEAIACLADFEVAGGLTAANLRYLRLSRAVMGLRLAGDASNRAAHLLELQALVNDATCPPHVALSAARWRMIYGAPSLRDAARATLSAGRDSLEKHRRLFSALAETQPGDDSAALLAAITDVTPGIAGHLHKAYAGAGLTAALLRWYLY
ncbi:MAG: hypothetical protein KC502_08940 [Myxococcales bacterium]|nr:hypothetical protein [Myxococcales bacterium]